MELDIDEVFQLSICCCNDFITLETSLFNFKSDTISQILNLIEQQIFVRLKTLGRNDSILYDMPFDGN